MSFIERDYTTYAEDLLPSQYQNASNTKGLLEIFLSEDKVFTDEIDKLFENAFDIDKASDYQLDILGKLSNLDRTSTDDDVYRRDIKLKRALDNSSGTRPEMINFLADVSNATFARSFDHYPASVVFSSDGDTVDVSVAKALQDISVAGVRVHGVIDTSTGRETIFPETYTAYDPDTSVEAGEEGMQAGEVGAEAGYLLLADSSQGALGELGDIYTEYVEAGAGEPTMQAGEEAAYAAYLYLQDGDTSYGIFGELFGAT